jgi:hypothetical protein
MGGRRKVGKKMNPKKLTSWAIKTELRQTNP